MNEVNLSSTIYRYLKNPQSPEGQAFMAGARSIMTALQLAPAADYPAILSAKNQQHIIALLVQSADQQHEQRRKDVKQLLRLYEFDNENLLAFIFDLAKIDPVSGKALNIDGEPVEDEMFRLLPGKTRMHWPQYAITHDDTDQSITRSQYEALDERAQAAYSSRRFLNLTMFGQSAMKISSSDLYLMRELVYQAILTSNPDVRRRFLVELHFDTEKNTYGKLYPYRDAVMDAFAELQRNQDNYGYPSTLMHQVGQGYIKNAEHLLISQLHNILAYTNSAQLLRYPASDIQRWAQVIQATNANNIATVSPSPISSENIITYRDAQGRPLRKANYDGQNKRWLVVQPHEEAGYDDTAREDFFWNILMLKVCSRLYYILNQTIYEQDLATVSPTSLSALSNLTEWISSHMVITPDSWLTIAMSNEDRKNS